MMLIIGHFSNSTAVLKFRAKGQILQLGSKFRGPRKTVGPSDVKYVCIVEQNIISLYFHITVLITLLSLLSTVYV